MQEWKKVDAMQYQNENLQQYFVRSKVSS